MYNLGRQILSSFFITNLSQNQLVSPFYKIEIINKSGAIIKSYDLDNLIDCPIRDYSYGLNKNGCGSGSISFGYLDFNLNTYSSVLIYRYGIQIYRGLVLKEIDNDGKLNLYPVLKRLDELQISAYFYQLTYKEIFQRVVNDIQADTGISYNEYLIDSGDNTTQFTLGQDGDFDTPKAIIEKLVESMDDREYRINANNVLEIYQPNSTVDYEFYSDKYSKCESEIDYSKMEATCFIVQYKDGSDNLVTCSTGVGFLSTDALYNASYPNTALKFKDNRVVSSVVGKIVKKFTAEGVYTEGEALEIAWLTLQSYCRDFQTITIDNIILDDIDIDNLIGKRISCFSNYNKQIRNIIKCDSLTNDCDDDIQDLSIYGYWKNATLDISDFSHGAGSVVYTSDYIAYEFDRVIRFDDAVTLQISIKTNKICNLEFSVTNSTHYAGSNNRFLDRFYETQKEQLFGAYSSIFYVEQPAQWREYSLTLPISEIRAIGFRCSDPTVTFKVDNISFFVNHQKKHEGNIVQADFKVTPGLIENVSLKLNDYDKKTNDRLISYNKKLNTLGNIITIN